MNISIVKSKTAYDIAHMLYQKYSNSYKYDMNGKWYYFDENNNTWVQNNEVTTYMIQINILTYICEKYMDMIYENNKNIAVVSKIIENKEIIDIISKLYTKTFQDNIIKECREFFYDINFMKNNSY
jgi:hypothetical protein